MDYLRIRRFITSACAFNRVLAARSKSSSWR